MAIEATLPSNVETVSGLLAILSSRVRGKSADPRCLSEENLSNGVAHLQQQSKYAEVLQYLDFDNTSGSYYSAVLERMLFLMGTWELTERTPYGVLMKEDTGESWKTSIYRDSGEDTWKFLEGMADDYLTYVSQCT